MDFLFHKVSEKEKQEIKEQAKKIMDSFSRKLSRVDTLKGTPKKGARTSYEASKKISESLIEREQGERVEGGGEICDEEFRKIMFENAPNKDDDFIVGEKKAW